MAEWIEMTVGENVGIRLDKYLADQLTDYTRSFIQKQIEQEGVKVNNQIVNSKYKVKSGDQIEVCIPDPIDVDIVSLLNYYNFQKLLYLYFLPHQEYI